jgi:hypothetical protein
MWEGFLSPRSLRSILEKPKTAFVGRPLEFERFLTA